MHLPLTPTISKTMYSGSPKFMHRLILKDLLQIHPRHSYTIQNHPKPSTLAQNCTSRLMGLVGVALNQFHSLADIEESRELQKTTRIGFAKQFRDELSNYWNTRTLSIVCISEMGIHIHTLESVSVFPAKIVILGLGFIHRSKHIHFGCGIYDFWDLRTPKMWRFKKAPALSNI